MEKIKVTFLFDDNDSFSTDMTSGFVEFVDEYDHLVELLVDEDKLQEIKVDMNVNGHWYTYHVDTVKPYKDGDETKYAVMTWARCQEVM